MRLKKGKIIALSFLIFLIIFCTIFKREIDNSFKIKNGYYSEIGKMLYFTVDENEVLDYKVIQNIINEEKEHILEIAKREMLIDLHEYMLVNNLQIKTGKYKINQAYNLEEVLQVIEFEKLTKNSYNDELKEKVVGFLVSEGFNIDDEIELFEVIDLDFDNNKDILIVFGVYKQFLLEENGDSFLYYEIDDTNRTDKIEVVKFNSFDYPFIHIVIKNAFDRPLGFRLLMYKENKIEEYLWSATGTNSGYDYIFDDDNDGVYDGYTQDRNGYDYFFQDVKKVFLAKNGKFVLENYEIDFDEYTETPYDIVRYYFVLSELNSREEAEIEIISNYLKEISKIEIAIDYDLVDGEMIDNMRSGAKPCLQFETTQQEDNAEVMVYIANNDELSYYCKFYLENLKGKWVITDFLK